MVKRCSFCGHKLDDDGFCTNEKCPEFIRAQIIKAADEEKVNDEGDKK